MKKLWDWYIEGIEKGIYSSFERISSSFRLARNLWRGVKKGRHPQLFPRHPRPAESNSAHLPSDAMKNECKGTTATFDVDRGSMVRMFITPWILLSRRMTKKRHSGSAGHRFVSTLSFRLRPESMLKGLLRQSPCSFLAMTKKRHSGLSGIVVKRPVLFISFALLIILLPLLFLVLKYRPFSAQAGWFNDNWAFRQTVSLVNTGSAQTDFQVMIATDSASMITAGRLKNDCSDIRITDINGKKLPYWVEPNTCNTAQTKIWTKVPSIPASTGTATSSAVFLYYGNPSAQTESNSKNVFIREISNVAGAWNMDESSWNGTLGEVKDSSGNGNNGQAQGGANTTSGKFGKAGNFNGSSNYVLVPASSTVDLYTPFTIEAWIQATTYVGDQGGFIGTYAGNYLGYYLSIANGAYFFQHGGGNPATGGSGIQRAYVASSITYGEWHHMIGVFDGSNLRIYLDGILKSTANNIVQASYSGQTFTIGKENHANYFFNGLIDEPRIYSKALSSSEIADLYGTGGDRLGYTSPNYPGKELVRKYSSAVSYNLSAVETGGTAPIAYWKFDEGQGVVAKDSATPGDATTNLVTNPSFETGVGGWSAYSGIQSFTQDVSVYNSGKASLKMITVSSGVAGWSSVYTDEISVTAQTSYTASAYFKSDISGDSNVGSIVLRWYDSNHNYISNNQGANINRSTSWQRVRSTATSPSNAAYVRVQVTGYNPINSNLNYWFDSIQFEQNTRVTDYCDGSLTNRGIAKWNGTAHASTSTCVQGNNGTINGATWQTEDQCVTGKCLSFNGSTTNFVNAGSPLFLNKITKDITVSAWIRGGTVSNPDNVGIIVSKYGSGTDAGWLLCITSDGIPHFDGRDHTGFYRRSGINGTKRVDDNLWHLLTGQRIASTWRVYVDGVLYNSSNVGSSGDISNPIDPLTIGALGTSGNGYYKGSIDDVKIYSYARTAAQIKADYIAGKGKAAMAKGANAVLGSNNKQGDFLSKGLVGYWKMDEASWNGTSGEVKDSSGNNNNGTAQGITGTSTSTGNSSTIVCDSAKTWTVNALANDTVTLTSGTYSGQTRTIASNTATCITVSTAFGGTPGSDGYKIMPSTVGGKFGNGGSFDGSGNYVSVSNSSSLAISGNQLTMSVWINRSDNVSSRDILSKYYNELRLFMNASQFGVALNSNGVDTITYAPINNCTTLYQWQLLTVTYNGSYINFYCNGSFLSKTAASGNLYTTSYNLSIGKTFYGSIDDVRIYNRALSPAEVSALYNWAPGPLIYYKMDEGSGTTVTDSSGNGYNANFTCDGTNCTATPKWKTGKYGKGIYFSGASGSYPNNNAPKLQRSSVNIPSTLGARATFSMWINPDVKGYSNIIMRNGTVTNENYGIFLNNPSSNSYKPSFNFHDGTNFRGSPSSTYFLPAKKWSYLTIAYSQGEWVKYYLNGQFIEQVSNPYISVQSTDTLNIGSNFNGDNYAGYLDDFKMYNYERTQKQIVEDMNAGDPAGTNKSMVGYWKFDEGAGTTVHNAGNGGSALDGSWNGTGGHWSVNGKVGKAGTFNGSSDYAEIPNNASLNMGTNPFTISAWVKSTPNGATQSIVSKFGNNTVATRYGYDMVVSSNGNFGIEIRTVNGVYASTVYGATTNTSFNDGMWHHVVAVTDRTSYTNMYVDGKKQNTNSTGLAGLYDGGSVDISNTNTLQIGRQKDYGGNFYYPFLGSIDEVKVYNYALTADEIKEDYNKGSAMVLGASGDDTTSLTNGLVGWWKMDEASWNGTAGEVVDSSGNGNNGASACYGTGCTVPSTATAKYGNGANLNGTSQFVKGTIASGISTNQITMSTWIQALGTSSNFPDIMSYGGSYNSIIYLMTNTYKLYYRFGNISGTNYDQTCNYTLDNNWHLVTVTFDGKSASCYVDGILTNSRSAPGVLSFADNSIFIGNNGSLNNPNTANLFNGHIDDTRIYNRALSATEIAQLYTYNPANQLMSRNSTAAQYCVPGDTSFCNPPVAEYLLDEKTGTTVKDTSGNNNNGTWSGTGKVHYVPGKFGYAGNFNGSSDYVNAGSNSSLYPTTAITAEAWIRIGATAINYPRILSTLKSDGTWKGYEILLNTASTQVYAQINTGGTFRSIVIGAPNLNTWTHVAFTYDGSYITAYYNGAAGNRYSATGLITYHTTPPNLTIGYNSNVGTYLNGQIDQIRIYNYARSPAQIAWDYNKGGPIAQWKMDECKGTAINDASGNGNTGTLTVGSGGTQTQPGTCADGNTASAWNNGKNGKFGSSLNFDGSDDSVNLPNLSYNKQISVGGWFKIPVLYNQRSNIWWKGPMPIDNAHELKLGWSNYGSGQTTLGANLRLTAGVCYLSSGGAYNDNTWHHVFVTSNTVTVIIYIDGKIASTGACLGSGNFSQTGYNDQLATQQYLGTGGNFKGQLDDVRIYNYALTPSQVQNVFNEGSAVRFGPTTGSGP
ncbi:DUF2341 domain-containing protein [Candidatus Roizmanbacteria bacterium]|nr:DUF2341 domain-containing protein [Candidatus Roizmanbacteria bacterium]